MARSESIVFNGITFRRYPDAKQRADRVCFVPGGSHRQRGVGRLHEEIWKAAHGPILPGHHIHHKDTDPLNNDPSNLECLPGADHLSHHLASRDLRTPERLAHMEAIRPLAAEWHRSEEGHAWHREHGQRTFGDRPMVEATCEQCGEKYETNTPWGARFCSGSCATKWRKLAGLDDEDRLCPGCGTTFTINKYARAVCCSRKCAWTVRKRQRAA